MEPTYRIAQRLHERRAAKGLETYGRHLDADSRGCMLVHAIEEAADQVNYLLADIQRRREAIRILLDTAERLTQWNDVNLDEDARQLVRVIDLLGGESGIAQYDEILGRPESATDPRDEALRVATEALETVKARWKAWPPITEGTAHSVHLGQIVVDVEAALVAIRAAGGAR